MDCEKIIEDLKLRFLKKCETDNASGLFTSIEFINISKQVRIQLSELCEKIALHTAHKYHHEELSFEFSDTIINLLHCAQVDENVIPTNLFLDIFYAFDEGEYYHTNARNDDPIANFTKPMIADVVLRYPVLSDNL